MYDNAIDARMNVVVLWRRHQC